jgi:hypothetical protein
MGESRASGESVLGDLAWESACYGKDDFMSIGQNTAYLYRFSADKFKYVHTQPFGYNKCKISSAFKAALMVNAVNGEKKA